MKTISTLSLSLILLLGACKKNATTYTGTYNVPNKEVCVSGFLAPNLTTETITIGQADLKQSFGNNGKVFDSTAVTTAKLTAAKISVTDGDLGDVETAKIAIRIQGASGDGTVIAHYAGGSTGPVGTIIPLTIDNVDLKPFISTSSEIILTLSNKNSAGKVCLSFNNATITITENQ